MPGDFVVGVYYPWLDYKWGYSVGVPVKNPITADVPSFIFPMQNFAVNILKSGKIPLWNPLILMGTPLLANFQSAPFSPTNFLYFIFDNLTAWGLQIFLQHLIAALSVYFLMRHWKVTKMGSILSASIFAFSGFNLIWSEWNGHALSAAFIPLIILAEDKWIVEGSKISLIFFPILIFLELLSGYPQVVLYTVVAGMVLAVVRLLENKNVFIRILSLSLFGLIGFGLSAIQILPGWELLKYSQRTIEPHPFDWAFLPWQKVITFISSDFFGNHASNNYWGPQDYTSNTGFVGIVAFVLSLFSLDLIRKNKVVLFASLTALVALLLAFPTPISIYLWKSGFLGLNAAAAHRSLVIFTLSISFLAGFGYDWIDKNIDSKKTVAIYLFTSCFLLVFLLYAYLMGDQKIVGSFISVVALRNLAIPILLFILFIFIYLKIKSFKFLFIILSVFELFYFGWKFTPFSPREIIFPKTPVIDYLTSQEKPFRVSGNKVIPMNMLMAYGIETPEGYDAVYGKNISKLISAINDNSQNTKTSGRYGSIDRLDSRILDLVNTKYFLALKTLKDGSVGVNGNTPALYDSNKFKKVFEDKSVVVYENLNSLPRAFMVYDWEKDTGDDQTLSKILNVNFPLGEKIIVNSDITKNSNLDNIKGNYSIKYLDYKSQGSEIDVKTNKAGMLFVSDSYFPGWNVYIDGEKSQIIKADFAFRAVYVAQGDHRIVFSYEPESFLVGKNISLISAAILLFYILCLSFLKIKSTWISK